LATRKQRTFPTPSRRIQITHVEDNDSIFLKPRKKNGSRTRSLYDGHHIARH
jgi:hypothetical protein